VVVQTVGVASIYCIHFQLAMARAMPSTPFIVTSVAVGLRLISNFPNYHELLNVHIRRLWEDYITVGRLSVLPQVILLNFVPYLPRSIFTRGFIICGSLSNYYSGSIWKTFIGGCGICGIDPKPDCYLTVDVDAHGTNVDKAPQS